MFKHSPDLVGEFQERDNEKYFSFKVTTDPWALANNLPYQIDVLDGVRYARILKTVVYVAIDETADGKPVLEKWHVKTNFYPPKTANS